MGGQQGLAKPSFQLGLVQLVERRNVILPTRVQTPLMTCALFVIQLLIGASKPTILSGDEAGSSSEELKFGAVGKTKLPRSIDISFHVLGSLLTFLYQHVNIWLLTSVYKFHFTSSF
jgi:hypothetical protein